MKKELMRQLSVLLAILMLLTSPAMTVFATENTNPDTSAETNEQEVPSEESSAPGNNEDILSEDEEDKESSSDENVEETENIEDIEVEEDALFTDENADVDGDGYHDGDVAVVQNMIKNNGLVLDGEFYNTWKIGWTEDSPKRINHLYVECEGLYGEVDLSGLLEVKEIEISNNNISGLKLSGCRKLVSLRCSANKIQELDLSDSLELWYLSCSYNQIKELSLSENSELTGLDCYNNQLTQLNVRGLESLDSLGCYQNELTYLDLEGLTSLETLNCSSNLLEQIVFPQNNHLLDVSAASNRLTDGTMFSQLLNLQSLDCSQNFLSGTLDILSAEINSLDCSDNQLAYIDMIKTDRFNSLNCSYNILKELDVIDFQNLTNLSCGSNMLTTLDVGPCSNLDYLNCESNQIETLVLPYSPNIRTLICHNNRIKGINLTFFDDLLGPLSLWGNPIESFVMPRGEVMTFTQPTNGELWMNNFDVRDYHVDLLAVSENTAQKVKWTIDGKEEFVEEKGIYFEKSLFVDGEDIAVSVDFVLGNPGTDSNKDGYHDGDVSVIDNIIANNGLAWTKSKPATWPTEPNGDESTGWALVTWKYDAFGVKRINSFEYVSGTKRVKLKGNLNLSKLDLLETISVSNSILSGLQANGSAIKEVFCDNNKITTLSLNTNSLENLSCRDNLLKGILDLSAASNLQNLDCTGNQLTKLQLYRGEKASVLETLACGYNALSELDVASFNNLISLDCGANGNISELDISQCPKLQYLNCESNRITELDLTEKHTLNTLICQNNLIRNLDISDTMVRHGLSLWGNPIEIFISWSDAKGDAMTYCITQPDNAQVWINGYNPTTYQLDLLAVSEKPYKYVQWICDDGMEELSSVETMVDDGLHAYTNYYLTDDASIRVAFSDKRSDLDPDANRDGYHDGDVEAINQMIAENGLLWELDSPELWPIQEDPAGYNPDEEYNDFNLIWVSDESGLLRVQGLYLVGGYNTLVGEMDLRDLPYLEEFYCQDNGITDVLLDGLSVLRVVSCNYNDLSSLNLNGLNSLVVLKCRGNSLTQLDLTGLNELEILDCAANVIRQIQIDNPEILQSLDCSNNKISRLDVSKMQNLRVLKCTDNFLTGTLDVSACHQLEELECTSNEISSLKFAAETETALPLRTLYCGYNLIKSLDLTGLGNLEELDCGSNFFIETLDVQNCPNLVMLNCAYNRIDKLDISALSRLETLCCPNNQLTELIFANKVLTVSLYGNLLEKLVLYDGREINIEQPSNGNVFIDSYYESEWNGPHQYIELVAIADLPATWVKWTIGDNERNEEEDGTTFYTTVDLEELSDSTDIKVEFGGENFEPVKLTFDVNDDDAQIAQTMKNVYRALPYGDLPEPYLKGYTFAGWYTAKSSGTKVTKTTVVPKTAKETKVLYARWTANKYSLTFFGNGATGGKMAAVTDKSYTKTATIPANAFTKKGYVFDGWNTQADGKGADYSDKQAIQLTTFANVNKTKTTLYAQWKLADYTLTYIVDGAEFDGENPSSYTMLDDTVILKDPRKIGNVFEGWYRNESFTSMSKVDKIPSGTTGDLTLYAKWTPYKLTINFDGNGNTSGSKAPLTVNYGEIKWLGDVGFYKDYHAFTEWTEVTDEGTLGYSKGDPFENDRTMNKDAEITLHANWEELEVPHYIILNGNGAKETQTVSVRFFEDDKRSISLPKNIVTPPEGTPYFTKKGYEFIGWTKNKTEPLGADDANPNGLIADNTLLKDIGETNNVTTNLYACWRLAKYEISYRDVDGIVLIDCLSDYYDFTQKVVLSDFNKVPIQTGYTFTGWYTAATGGSKVTGYKVGTTGDKKLYARWTPVKYSVVFDGNGNTSGSMKKITATYDKDFKLTANKFKKTGYTFSGWALSTGEAEEELAIKYADKATVEDEPLDLEKGITLKAIWTPTEYKIVYQNIDKVTESSLIPEKGSTYTIENEDIVVSPEGGQQPQRPGYTFAGWYKNKSARNQLEEAERTIKKGSTGDKTFYAKWTGNDYTIKFEKGEEGIKEQVAVKKGKIELTDKTATYGKAFTLPANPYERKDYVFAGWKYADGSADGQIFGDKAKLTEVYTSEDAEVSEITLVAQWDEAPYKITYKNITKADFAANSALERDQTYSKQEVASTGKTLLEPKRVGWTFDGWYTSSSKDAQKVEEIAKESTGPKTFYARWTPLTYKIKFNENGGTTTKAPLPEEGITKTYGTALTLPANPYTKAGYTFGGWEAIGVANPYANKAKITTDFYGGTDDAKEAVGVEGITLKAIWKPVTYKVKYVNIVKTDIMPEANKETYTDLERITLANPSREGATFDGWYYDKAFTKKVNVDGENPFDASKNDTLTWFGNQTIYAKWINHKYDVYFAKFNEDEDEGVTPVTGKELNPLIGKEGTKTFTLPSNPYKRAGYSFKGWKVKPAEGDEGLYTEKMKDTIYPNKAKVTNLTIGKPDGEPTKVTLAAQWELITYTVTYKGLLQGQTGVKADVIEKYTVETPDMIHPTPTREGYEFKGWYTKANGKGTKSDRIAAKSTGNKTLYAYWVSKSN